MNAPVLCVGKTTAKKAGPRGDNLNLVCAGCVCDLCSKYYSGIPQCAQLDASVRYQAPSSTSMSHVGATAVLVCPLVPGCVCQCRLDTGRAGVCACIVRVCVCVCVRGGGGDGLAAPIHACMDSRQVGRQHTTGWHTYSLSERWRHAAGALGCMCCAAGLNGVEVDGEVLVGAYPPVPPARWHASRQTARGWKGTCLGAVGRVAGAWRRGPSALSGLS